MLNKWDLQSKEGSLDMLISAISSDLTREQQSHTPAAIRVVKEMQEALEELRRKRNIQRLLIAIEESRRAHRKASHRASH